MNININFNGEGYKRAIETEFKIVDEDKNEVPFKLNKSQDHFVLKIMPKFLDIVILKARKMGFSSVILAIIVLKFLLGKNERCVSMSFDATAAGKQLERAKMFIRAFERRNKISIPFKYNTKKEMVYTRVEINPVTGEEEEITNTLRIGAATSKSFGRGDDVTFLHVTETSLCDDMDSLLAGIGEACVPGAHKVFETTANGFNNFKKFWDLAVKGVNGFLALFYGPEWKYSEEFIMDKHKRLGKIGIQEYPRNPQEAFLTSGECWFDSLNLGRMLESVKNMQPIPFQFELSDPKWKQYRLIEKGEFILLPVDTASGGADNTVCAGISKTKIDNPFNYVSNDSTTMFIPELVRVAEAIFDFTGVKPCIAFERNRGGDFLMDRVAAMNHLGKFTIMLMPDFGKDKKDIEKGDLVARTNKLGWDTNSATRPKMLEEFQEVINKLLLGIYDPDFIEEMLSFINKNGRGEAEKGTKDDRVMVLAIGWQMFLYQPVPKKAEDISSHQENFRKHQMGLGGGKKRDVIQDGLYMG